MFANPAFSIMIVMRLFPRALQPYLVWLFPLKWRFERNFRKLENLVVPEAEKMLKQKDLSQEMNLLAWMIQFSRNEAERDPYVLTKIQAATAAGGTHSVGMFIDTTLYNILCQPGLLEQIRQEIEETHKKINGIWDQNAYDSLLKLDSSMKETSRFSPPSMITYARMVMSNHTLSSGI